MKCSCFWCSSALCCGQQATCSCAEIILYFRMVGSEERPGTTWASLFRKEIRRYTTLCRPQSRGRTPAATIAEPLDQGAVVVTEADESV